MRLTRFAVTNFRSVDDSGWIDVDNVTALIGVNESGKTNLLLPLWKLNPAREGEIHPVSDYPKKKFGEIRDNPEGYCFIKAEFETGSFSGKLSELAGITEEEASIVIVERYFDGRYELSFPRHNQVTQVAATDIKQCLQKAVEDIREISSLKQETDLQVSIINKLEDLAQELPKGKELSPQQVEEICNALKQLLPTKPARTSLLVPRTTRIIEHLEKIHCSITGPVPEDQENVLNAVTAALPKFVYYSNYGNLDSEIYLPHVVQNLSRSDLGAKEAAKARTLRVLFRFVRLEPQEILDLGHDFKDPTNPTREPTPSEIEEIAERKRERSILLQSAGATLTRKFKEWWKQGDYHFRFEADGSHFRIWVSDDLRPEEVELESRSTGLQWFLSFYLVFLVESEGEHQKAILLLDEPGLSLHPLAQRSLSVFFDGLAETNQILYTTHSPFLVDADRLERARKVYIAEDGTTKATPNLRHGDAGARDAGAAYAVHSALNLSVAESLLLGCQPIIVEGASDQHYLTAIKALLIGAEKISPKRELVFPPSGGTKTARIVASILTGRDEKLPMILLDGDEPGKRMTRELHSSLYSDSKDYILSTDDYVCYEKSEVEDFLPSSFFAQVIDRWERTPETPFSDVVQPKEPLVGQVEEWAKSQNVKLPEGWKVEVAKRAKSLMLTRGIKEFDEDVISRWIKLFEAFAKNTI